MKKMSFKD